MRTPEFYNEKYFCDDELDLVDLIGEIQQEAYSKAVDDVLSKLLEFGVDIVKLKKRN